MDIMLEEILHVFVKIYSFIVLSKTMSNFSVYGWLSPSHTFKQFHKTRQGNLHCKRILSLQNPPLYKPPERHMN